MVFRLIGRLAFPLYAWMIGNGYKHTSNAGKYLWRLVWMGLISQLPYRLIMTTINPGFNGLNIFTTLVLGLLGVMLVNQKQTGGLVKILGVIGLVAVGETIKVDYGGLGVLLTIGLGKWVENRIKSGLFLGFVVLISLVIYWSGLNWLAILRVGTLLALPLILAYNGLQGSKRFNWLFYWIYPVHLVILLIIKMVWL
jgi:hypothetical protein